MRRFPHTRVGGLGARHVTSSLQRPGAHGRQADRPACPPPVEPPGAMPSSTPSTRPAGTTTPATSATPRKTAPTTSASIRPRVDEGAGDKALISASQGGKLQAKAANGISYTLEIPKDALLMDEFISLAPITQIDGLALSGGLLGAVDLKPEGLRFIRPAILTIRVPAGFKKSDLIGFAYRRAGEGLHRYPVTGDGSSVTVKLTHFSGYGGGTGSEGDSQAMGNSDPLDDESSFADSTGEAMEKARRNGTDPSESKELEDAFRTFFESQVLPDLKSAEGNDEKLESALNRFLDWLRQVESCGMGDKLSGEIQQGHASAKKGLRNAFEKASEKCVKQVDYEQGFRLVHWTRQSQLLYGEDYPDLQDRLEKCWRFRLDYESIVKWEMDNNMKFTSQVKSEVTMRLKEDLTSFEGEGPLEYVAYEMEWTGESAMMNGFCQADLTSSSSTLKVSPLVTGLNIHEPGSPPRVMAVFDPGDTQETWGLKCNTGAGSIRTQMPMPAVGWSAGFTQVHKDKKYQASTVNGAAQGRPGYLFNEFQEAGKPVVARETGKKTATVQGSTVTDEYTIDIVHVPSGGGGSSSSSTDSGNGTNREVRGPQDNGHVSPGSRVEGSAGAARLQSGRRKRESLRAQRRFRIGRSELVGRRDDPGHGRILHRSPGERVDPWR